MDHCLKRDARLPPLIDSPFILAITGYTKCSSSSNSNFQDIQFHYWQSKLKCKSVSYFLLPDIIRNKNRSIQNLKSLFMPPLYYTKLVNSQPTKIASEENLEVRKNWVNILFQEKPNSDLKKSQQKGFLMQFMEFYFYS